MQNINPDKLWILYLLLGLLIGFILWLWFYALPRYNRRSKAKAGGEVIIKVWEEVTIERAADGYIFRGQLSIYGYPFAFSATVVPKGAYSVDVHPTRWVPDTVKLSPSLVQTAQADVISRIKYEMPELFE